MTYIIGGDAPQSEGKGPIHRMIEKVKAQKKAQEELKSKEMVSSSSSEDKEIKAPGSDPLVNFTHKDWVRIYESQLSHMLKKVSERVTKLSSGDERFPASYILSYRIYSDRLTDHPSGAAAAVGVEVTIRENGVARLLTRVNRFFRTTLEFKEGKDQGIMESLQQVFEDFTTLAVTTDIATRYEQQQINKGQ